MAAAGPSSASPLLPELRQELSLHAGPSGSGETSWLVYDPVRHRYFQLSRGAMELLRRWRPEPAADLAARCARELQRPVSVAEVNELAKLVIANNLALDPPDGDARALARQEAGTRHSVLAGVVHNYLFFKVPLFRPERFLQATMPFVEPLFSRAAAVAVLMVSLAGLYLASRQWDLFAATFLDFLSFEGALVYGATLVVVKSLHELGHAYAATRAGVRVNTMGVAFMVLTPILYTDVTDAWRLRHRRDKLAIDAAGIVVELALAGLAIFLWTFLPDGPLRSAAFVTATTSLVMGLVVNLNPLMRFDGYHLLADAWQIPNLQARSNELAGWWLRESLFGLRKPPPEPFAPRRARLLIAYALAVWIYRLLLFLGIALLVYHMFFKALGIVLFAVEILWFIALPIGREISQWWKMRAEIVQTRRTRLSAAITAIGLALLVIPWSGTVRVQGVALSDLETRIYAPRAARVVSLKVHDSEPVAAGQTLLVLAMPDLDHEASRAAKQIELARIRLDRIAGDETDRSNRVVLQGELERHRTSLAGLKEEQRRLIVRAPHAGIVRDLDRELKAGEWLDNATPVARVVRNEGTLAQGYIAEDDIWRVAAGSHVRFVPEDPAMPARSGRIIEVVQTGSRTIDLPYLASVYGGAVPSDRSPENEIRPRSGRHLVRVGLDGGPVDRAVRGTLLLSGGRESIAAAMWRRILRVLVRESSA